MHVLYDPSPWEPIQYTMKTDTSFSSKQIPFIGVALLKMLCGGYQA